jgi:hypothetical protein
MGWLLLLIGIFIFAGTFLKIKPKTEKEAEAYQWEQKHKWKFRIAGILLFLIGLGMLGSHKETKTTQPTQSQQTATSQASFQQQETKKETPKTFGELEDFENKLQKKLGELDIYYTIKNAPLADGRPRKIYDAKFSSIEIIGSPKLEQVSVMFIPTTSEEENMKSIAFILLPFNILCNQEGNKAKSEKFIDTLTQIMENSLNRKSSKFADKELTFPPCNVKILSGTRNFPLWVVTFRKI